MPRDRSFLPLDSETERCCRHGADMISNLLSNSVEKCKRAFTEKRGFELHDGFLAHPPLSDPFFRSLALPSSTFCALGTSAGPALV